MSDVLRKIMRPDYTDDTVGTFTAKLTAIWAAWFGGLSLGDLATLAALIYTLLNISFLLYDRLIKKKKEKDKTSEILSTEGD